MISSKKDIALVIGSGSHAKVVISILKENFINKKIIIYSKNIIYPDEKIFDIPIQTSESLINDLQAEAEAYIAIGDNIERAYWYNELKKINFSMPNLLASSAILDSHVDLGQANIICHKAYLGPGAQLKDNNLINTASILEHDVSVGSHNHFAPGSISLGSVSVENFNFIGSQSVVKEKIKIGNNIVVGAGAIILNNIEEHGSVYVGNPGLKMLKGKKI